MATSQNSPTDSPPTELAEGLVASLEAAGKSPGKDKREFYAKEIARCSTDLWYWLTTYVFVLDPDPDKGIIRFQNWPHLKALVWLYQTQQRLLILKSRQVGVSWLYAAIALWVTQFHPGTAVAIFSKREVDSTAMKNRAKFMWEHQPEWMRIPHGKDNDELLEFPIMNSKIQSFPATEDTGRAEGATLVIIDEWAFHRYARVNWAAIAPIGERAKIIGISTANGTDNLFAEK